MAQVCLTSKVQIDASFILCLSQIDPTWYKVLTLHTFPNWSVKLFPIEATTLLVDETQAIRNRLNSRQTTINLNVHLI